MRSSVALSLALVLLLPATALYLNVTLDQSEKQAAAAATPVVLTAASERTDLPPEPDLSPTPAATQNTASDPLPIWGKAPLLEAAVQAAMVDFPGEYSVIVQELESGQRFAYNPDQPYHPASTIKMPVTLYALEQHRAGKIGWQDLIEYTPADFESPGGGLFETAPFGGLYPIENLVNRSLKYSNNVAVNMLGRHLGWANIEAWTKTIEGDLDRIDGSPRVTALSELGWWLHLHRLSQEDPQTTELLLTPLGEVEYDGRITAGLPDGTPHLHKFGSYNGNYHDGGIIYATHPYILIVLTHGAQVDEADATIARLSAAIFAIMNTDEL